MANIKSAKKKQRQDQKKTKLNLFYKNRYQKAVRNYLKKSSHKAYQKACSMIDRATKAKIMHPHKAARLKTNLKHNRKKKNG